MTDHYTECLSVSEPSRKLYADSVENAVAVLRKVSRQERMTNVTPESMAQNRDFYRREYAHLLGIDRCIEVFGNEIPDAELSPAGEDSLCRISRIRLRIYDGIYFTGLLLTPHKKENRAPLVVMSHGGGGSPELCCDLLGSNNYGGVVRQLLKNGAVVFAPQLLLWNLSPKLCESSIPLYTTPYNREKSDRELKQCGTSIAGFEIYEISRALNYLLVQDGIAPEKCGMLGLSYGGFYTLYTMAYETRIRCGWSAAFFNDRIRYDWQDFVWKNSASRFLDTEVAGLCAPRQLWCDIGKNDTVFSGEGVDSLFDRVYRFYTAAGNREAVRMNLWDGGHRFSGDDAFRFFLNGLNH